jgi:hypothetical protein
MTAESGNLGLEAFEKNQNRRTTHPVISKISKNRWVS